MACDEYCVINGPRKCVSIFGEKAEKEALLSAARLPSPCRFGSVVLRESSSIHAIQSARTSQNLKNNNNQGFLRFSESRGALSMACAQIPHQKIKKMSMTSSLFWCGKWDLNPYVVRHTPLKRACLPIPALPHIKLSGKLHYYITRKGSCQGVLKNFLIQIFPSTIPFSSC